MRSFRRASWGRRAVAFVLDAIVIAVPVSVVVALTGIGSSSALRVVHGRVVSTHVIVGIEQQILQAALWIAAQGLYRGCAEGGPRGQTLGKRWAGIATVDAAGGGPLGFARAALRGLVVALGLCLLFPGAVDMLWPWIDAQRRALHDLVFGSAVIDVTPS